MLAAENYRIDLPHFEGPLDLLLHLIKKNHFNVYDIPVAPILQQYMQYLNLAKEFNIDLAGEFLEMAAELAYIKSKMLLPEPEVAEEEGPDPRADLVQKLLEYQKYKMAASLLLEKPLLGRDVFRRQPMTAEKEEEEAIEVDLLKLLSAFQTVLSQLPQERIHEARSDRIGVAERIMELIELVRGKKQVLFEELFQTDQTKGELVVTFLAILEMGRQKLIRIVQESNLGPIVVCALFQEDS